YGPAPWGFHLTNILLHMINVALLMTLAWQCARDRIRGAGDALRALSPMRVMLITGVLFAVHPMMTEAVGYIGGRSELIVAAFFLTAILAARRWFSGLSARWAAIAVLSWFLALFSKEIAVMLPLVLLAYDRWVWPDTDDRRRYRFWRFHAPLLALMAVAVVGRLVVFVFVESRGLVDVRWQFALIELDVIRRYLGLLLWPTGQAIFHLTPPIESIVDARVLIATAVIGAMVGVAWWVRHRAGLITLGVIWFFLLLVPSSALVLLNRGEPMAEHRVYLASAGLFLAAGMIVARVWRRLGRSLPITGLAARGAIVLMVALLAGSTVLRNALWDDPVLVWAEAAGKAEGHWLPNVPLGQSLHAAGRHDEAIGAFVTALRSLKNQPDALGGLGTCLAETGRLDEAAGVFQELRAVAPRSTVASNGLATVALLAGRADEARTRYGESLTIDPVNIQARRGLAALEETVGNNPGEALRLCREIETIAPGTPGIDECIKRNRARIGGGE
ncbi:MAG TPA: tetratricopeptide repeat protein, partial [Vicinamibacterales bacterium]|nr:tetratricopeptide repeat protein [Vicinamibacterales bacterium]